MKATIKSIAEACNLSTTAVSLVLNGKPIRISDEARTLILETAKKMNYSPNQIAVGLVKGRTRTIGLILTDVSNMFLAEIAKTIEIEMRKYHYTVLFGNTGDSGKRELEYIKEFIGKSVEGIIMIHSSDATPEIEKEIKSSIIKSDIPVVMLDNDMEDLEVMRCVVDSEKGGYWATKHLIEKGHRRIGCLLGPMGQCSVRTRLKGYKRALKEHGIEMEQEFLYNGDFTLQSGIDAMPYFLENKVTAVFCYNDMMAYGVYQYAREHDIKIGEEIAVIGYDDSFINSLLEVPLTSVKQPRAELARRATERLAEAIKKKERSCAPIILEPELSVRKSTEAYQA